MITKFNFTDCTIKSYAIRKLTPKECFRLMGVRDAVISVMQSTWADAKDRVKSLFGKANAKAQDKDMVISASQQFKQAGNSIVVDVLVGIIENVYYPPEYKTISFEDGTTYKVQDDGQLSFF